MKGLSYFGLALILLGAAALILYYFNGLINNNLITWGTFAAMLVGIIVYVLASKKYLDKN